MYVIISIFSILYHTYLHYNYVNMFTDIVRANILSIASILFIYSHII